MGEKIEPIIHKLSEAVPAPEDTAEHPAVPKPGEEPRDADVKQHNAEVHPDRKDRMVDIGRASNIAGRNQDRSHESGRE